MADGTDVEGTGFGDVDDIGVYVGEDAWLSVGLLKGGGGVDCVDNVTPLEFY